MDVDILFIKMPNEAPFPNGVNGDEVDPRTELYADTTLLSSRDGNTNNYNPATRAIADPALARAPLPIISLNDRETLSACSASNLMGFTGHSVRHA